MKKILIISPILTHPVNSGSKACILSYSKLLTEMGHDVCFFWTYTGYGRPYTETLRYWGDKFIIYKRSYNFFRKLYYNRFTAPLYKILKFEKNYDGLDSFYPYGIEKCLQKIQKEKQFDVVIVNYIFISKILNYFTGVKKILYTHDVFTNKYQHTGQKWFSLKPNDEAKGLNRADAILSIQENESIFYSFITSRKIHTVYAYFQLKETPLIGEKSILYMSGPNSYNIEAIQIFLTEIFPELEKLYPNVKLIIGGSICAEIENLITSNNIVLQGYVSDISEFYSQADICINPTFNGTGLKIKTFEALSFGKILIAHPHSVTGIYEKEKAPIFLAESKEQYIEQFTYLFNNTDSWDQFKKNAMVYMQRFQNHVKLQFEKAITE